MTIFCICLLSVKCHKSLKIICFFFQVKMSCHVDVFSSEEFRKHRREMNSMGTDESKRTKDAFNEWYMGMPGTFRTLSIDYNETKNSDADV